MRTRVEIPAAAAGHSFYLHFPAINMLGSVFVNGQLCGTTKAPFAVWDCDITKAVKPGGANEIWVGIKDTYYGLRPEGDNNPSTRFTIPTQWMNSQQFISQQLDFPVWNHLNNGILQTPTLVVAGKAYTADVFPQPSVKNKNLTLEITLKNPTDAPLTVSLKNEIVAPEADREYKPKTFAAQDVTLPANSEQVVKLTEGWANPKLWWPGDPYQYNVVTTLSQNGQPMDERRTKFGFREWEWQDMTNFKLNGVNWFGRADTATFAPTAAADLAAMKQRGINMVRYWSENGWHELSGPEESLDFFDAHGMPVRRTGIFDGEGVNYTLTPELFANWQTQLTAYVKGERNHPSIFIWSIENEITYINDNDGRGRGPTPNSAPFISRAAEAVAAVDPTRPQMIDGGNALGDESLPVYGIHYIEGKISDYPDWGYQLGYPYAKIAHAQGWPITQKKPLFFGEQFYSAGYDLTQLATAGGESALVGKAEARPAIGFIADMLSQGMRWSGVAAFHIWGSSENGSYYNAWQPIVVLQRQWDSTFGSGDKVTRTFGVFNDTHTPQQLAFTWTLNVGGKKAASKTAPITLAPGSNKKFDDVIPMPIVAARQNGELVLTLSAQGKEVFRDVKKISVLPAVQIASAPTIETRVNLEKKPAPKAAPKATAGAANLLVFDPFGSVTAFLQSRNVGFTPVADLGQLPNSGKVLIVGKDALDAAQSTSSALAAWASSGARGRGFGAEEPAQVSGVARRNRGRPKRGAHRFSRRLGQSGFCRFGAARFRDLGAGRCFVSQRLPKTE